jgi:hypothetical protein
LKTASTQVPVRSVCTCVLIAMQSTSLWSASDGPISAEVRFRNHGLDAIEVQDNGNGVSPDDFETLGMSSVV